MAETIFSEENNNQNVQKESQSQGEKKHKHLKPLLVILAVILLIGGTGFGIWYWQQNEIKNQKTESDKQISELQKKVTENSKTETKTDAKKTTWKTYTNNQDGFQLTFPETWKGYAVTETLTDDRQTKYIGFGLPSTKTCDSCQGYERNIHEIFSVSVYTKNGWAATNSEEGPKPVKIGEKGDKVYTYMHGNGIPMVNVTDPYDNANEIIKSFKILE